LKNLENRYLAPVPIYRAFPLSGIPPLTVNFHCFTNRLINRFFWDFGDGSASYEKNPSHTYLKAGNYTVQLRIISDQGGQGVATKLSYISVSDNFTTPFGYVIPVTGTSIATATSSAGIPTTFTFYDQTQGPIVNRLWQFGDGQSIFSEDPNVMVVTHQYQNPGTYRPSVLITIEGNIVPPQYVDLCEWYTYPNSVVFFNSFEDLIEKLREFSVDKREKMKKQMKKDAEFHNSMVKQTATKILKDIFDGISK
jgi:PKD repeat protein